MACSKELYATFLQVTSERYSCLSLSEVSPIKLSHDSISRWLKEAKCQPKEIWSKASQEIKDKFSGLLIADDTVLNKSRSSKMALVRWQYSGTVHNTVPGIGMVNLMWVPKDQEAVPVDLRIYEPKDDVKSKNDHFREMLSQAKARGLQPEAVVADSWYGSLKNLKAIRSLGWSWVMGLKKNRTVNRKQRLDRLEIPDAGLVVHLKGYGWITVFRFVAQNGRTDFIATNLDQATRGDVQRIVKGRWSIEVFHRELKQTCGLQRCQARHGRAQRNHITCAVLAWLKQHHLRSRLQISMYQQQWDHIKLAIAKHLKLLLNKLA